MQIFHAELTSYPAAVLGQEETRHCIKVLRHREGDLIYVTEGKGFLYQAIIRSFDKKETQLEIRESFENYGEHEAHIRLAVSPLRLKDRFEWMIEKSVELGVNEIIPLNCARTDVYKAKFKASRIETILLSALKQSKRSRLPLLQEAQNFEDWIVGELKGQKIMGWCETEEKAAGYLSQISTSDEINLLIGPEGDFTEKEVNMAKEAGFVPVSFGENRLRTETAAIYALSVIKWLKGY